MKPNKTIIDLSGYIDWNWRKGNADNVRKGIKQMRANLTMIEKELP